MLKLPVRYYRMYPKNSPLGYCEEEVSIEIANTALLIIDVYGKGFTPEEKEELKVPSFYISDPENDRIVSELIPKVRDVAKESKMKVIYLTNHLSEALDENNEWRQMSIRTCGVDVLESWVEPNDILRHSNVIAPTSEEVLIKKQMYSGFFETELESALRNANIKNLVVVGFDANICLKYTLVDALYRNFRVFVLRDCVRTMEFPETEAENWANFMAIRHIETTIGYTATSEDFVESMRVAAKA
jgi:nicotinamidase-related amidase